jgi:pilus assembly protein Flp/PilA
MNLVKRLVSEQEGQGMAEYALILGLIVVVVAVVMSPLGNAIKSKFSNVTTSLGS